MLGLFGVAFISFFVSSSSNYDYTPTFAIPFEISFNQVDEFIFNTQHLDTFINATSSYFSVQNDNITISFMRQLSGTTSLDIGFTVDVNTFNEENTIKDTDIDLYRAHLNIENNNLPNIIKITKKYKSCNSTEKYSTFYHYDTECQWLCDPSSVYDENTNQCLSTANMPTTVDVLEDNQPRFIGYGYITAVFITICSIFGYLVKFKWYPKYRDTIHNKFSKLLTPKSEYRSPEPGDGDDENPGDENQDDENVDASEIKLEEAENEDIKNKDVENENANLRKIEDEECNDENSKILQNDVKTKGEE